MGLFIFGDEFGQGGIVLLVEALRVFWLFVLGLCARFALVGLGCSRCGFVRTFVMEILGSITSNRVEECKRTVALDSNSRCFAVLLGHLGAFEELLGLGGEDRLQVVLLVELEGLALLRALQVDTSESTESESICHLLTLSRMYKTLLDTNYVGSCIQHF